MCSKGKCNEVEVISPQYLFDLEINMIIRLRVIVSVNFSRLPTSFNAGKLPQNESSMYRSVGYETLNHWQNDSSIVCAN